MHSLVLVRHGQASFMAADYDHLSDAGRAQMRALGALWRRQGRPLGRLITGPLRRQRDSLATFVDGYGGAPPADVITAPELDEYSALEVVDRAVKDPSHHSDDMRRWVTELATPGLAEDRRDELHSLLFFDVSRRWVRGDIVLDGIATWQDFRGVVEGWFHRVTAQADGPVLAFTSGGVIAAALGAAVGLDDLRTLEHSWIVRNASFTEFLHSQRRFGRTPTVLGFNQVPHLDPEHVTFR